MQANQSNLTPEDLAWVERLVRHCHVYPELHLSDGKHPNPVYADCLQEGRLALWFALGCFDPTQGVPLRGFAAKRVLGAIKSCLSRSKEFRRGINFENHAAGQRKKTSIRISLSPNPGEEHPTLDGVPMVLTAEVPDVNAKLDTDAVLAAAHELPPGPRDAALATLEGGLRVSEHARSAGLAPRTAANHLEAARAALGAKFN